MKKPIYSFENENSTGVDVVPDNSFLYVESFNGLPLTVSILNNGLTGSSTVQDLIDNVSWWQNITAYQYKGVAWSSGMNYKVGDLATDTLTAISYKCITQHASGSVFNDDLVNWVSNLSGVDPVITGSVTEEVYDMADSALVPSNGTIQYRLIYGDTTFTENIEEGQYVTLRLEDASLYTITWFTVLWIGGSVPTLTVGDALLFWKESGVVYGLYNGTTIQG